MKELRDLNIPGLDLENTVDDSLSSVLSRLNDFGKGPVHHPPCPRHDDHLLYFKGQPYCLGCFCVYSGMGLGVPVMLFFVYYLGFEVWTLALIGFLLSLLPSLLQIKIQVKSFKIFSRTILGVGMLLWFASILLMLPLNLTGLLLRVGGVIFYLAVALITLSLRRRFGKAIHCEDCPEGNFPICEFRLPMIEEMIEELEEKGEKDGLVYDFLISSRRQIIEKDGSAIITHYE